MSLIPVVESFSLFHAHGMLNIPPFLNFSLNSQFASFSIFIILLGENSSKQLLFVPNTFPEATCTCKVLLPLLLLPLHIRQ